MKYCCFPVGAIALLGFVLPTALLANPIQVRVTVENLAPANTLSFAPLRLGFNNGTFDSFNNGQAAGAAIISVAEGGSGADWFPAFAAADPTATLGTVVPNPPGPLVPGAMGSAVFTVDPMVNPNFFSPLKVEWGYFPGYIGENGNFRLLFVARKFQKVG